MAALRRSIAFKKNTDIQISKLFYTSQTVVFADIRAPFEFEGESVKFREFSEAFPDGDREKVYHFLCSGVGYGSQSSIEAQIFYREQLRTVEITLLRHPLDSFGSLVIRDITSESLRKESSKSIEDQLFKIINNSINMVFIVFREKFFYVNNSFCDTVLYAMEELPNKPISSLVHEGDLEKFKQRMYPPTEGDEPVDNTPLRFLSKNGDVVHLNTTLDHISIDGEAAFLCIAQDVTEIIQSKDDLSEALHKTMYLQSQLLRSQLNPHFISNTLNTLNYHLSLGNKDTCFKLTRRLSDMYRQMLVNSAKDFITLEEEVQFIQNYIEVEEFRLENRVTFDLQFPEHTGDEYYIPSMLVQPLVENAIVHGVMPKVEGGHIAISYRIEGEKMIVEVQDNGVGLPEEKQEREGHTSLSSALIKNRILTFKGLKDNDLFEVEIFNRYEQGEIAGCTAKLHLPSDLF